MKKKKILFLNPYVYPQLVKDKSYDEWKCYFGGAQLTIMSVINGLKKKEKYKLVVFVWNEFIAGISKTLGELQFVSGFYSKWHRKGGIYNVFFFMYTILLLIIVNPDYIIKAGYEGKYEIIISLYSMIFRKKYFYLVLTSTDLIIYENLLNKAIVKFFGVAGVDFVCQPKCK